MRIVKKPGTAESSNEEGSAVTIEDIMIGALSRGLSYDAIEKMTIGQIVDFCIIYNKQNAEENETTKPKSRAATQTDWNAFFGR